MAHCYGGRRGQRRKTIMSKNISVFMPEVSSILLEHGNIGWIGKLENMNVILLHFNKHRPNQFSYF